MTRYYSLVALSLMLFALSACVPAQTRGSTPARSPHSTEASEAKLSVRVGLVVVREIDEEPDRLADHHVYSLDDRETSVTAP